MHKYNYALLNKDYICVNALSTDSADAALQKVNVDDMIVEISSDLFDISLVGKKFDSATQMFSTVLLPPKTLDQTKTDKISQITSAYQNATQTFTSSALGTVHTYLADNMSMSKFNGKHYEINTSSYSGADINWYTVEYDGVMHTVAQLNQVWSDGNKALTDAFNKWDALVKQVKACTDITSVQAITW